MNEGTRKIIAVTPEESSLVRAGTVIMDDAMARKKKSEEETGSGIEPLLLFNSKAEANVVCEVDTLSHKYQKKLGLSEPPILVAELPTEPSATTSDASTQATAPQTSTPQPTMTLPSVPVGKFHFFERSNEKGPSHIQLENLLIGRVPLRRVGDTIYLWRGTYYRRKSDADVLTLIRKLEYRQAGGGVPRGRGGAAHHPRHLLHPSRRAGGDGEHPCLQYRRAFSGAWPYLSIWTQ